MIFFPDIVSKYKFKGIKSACSATKDINPCLCVQVEWNILKDEVTFRLPSRGWYYEIDENCVSAQFTSYASMKDIKEVLVMQAVVLDKI